MGLVVRDNSLLVGWFILATFLALFSYLTPSGRVTVTGRVVEVTPNVTGRIVAIPVKPNVPVKKDDLLFQIDPAPFQYKVMQLQASLAAAKQQTEILKSNYEQATANVTGLTAQVACNRKRLADIQTLASDDANSQFQAQDKQDQYETVSAQLGSAKAAQQSARLALDPRTAASTRWSRSSRHNLIAPHGNCHRLPFAHPPTAMSPFSRCRSVIARCRRARQCRLSLSEITLVGMFSHNGFQVIKEGAPVDIVFDNVPGRIYHAKIIAIPRGVGQGQIAVSGTLARTNTIGGATVYPAVISIPDGMSRDSLRLGMSGSATAFADNAGVIGLLASILVWISSYTAYLQVQMPRSKPR